MRLPASSAAMSDFIMSDSWAVVISFDEGSFKSRRSRSQARISAVSHQEHLIFWYEWFWNDIRRMQDEIWLTFSCFIFVMLNLFLMMMRHMLNIVEDYRDFLIDDVRKLMMHNDSDEQSLSYVWILKEHSRFSFLKFSVEEAWEWKMRFKEKNLTESHARLYSMSDEINKLDEIDSLNTSRNVSLS